MKNIISALLLGVMVYLSACDKKQEVVVENTSPYWGEVSTEKNGEKWNGKIYGDKYLSRGILIKIDSFDQSGLRKESVTITKVPLFIGTYPLYRGLPQTDDSLSGAGHFIMDDDVSLGYYDVLESDSSSFITLTSYDSLTKEIKGTFDATFIVKVRPYPGYPDTIRFRNGKFHTKIIR